MWRHLTACALCCTLMGIASLAYAQGEAVESSRAARALFERGLEHVDAQRWQDAEQSFRQARVLRDSPVIRFNLAVTLIELERLLEAQTMLAALAQDASIPAELREQSQRWLTTAETRLPKLVVRIDGSAEGASVTIDGRALAEEQLGIELPLDPGAHTVGLMRDERELEVRQIALAQGSLQVVVFTVAPTAAPAPDAATVAAQAIEPTPPPFVAPLSTKDDTKSLRARRLWWGLGGGAAVIAVGVVTGVVLASRARSSSARYEGDFDPPAIHVQVPQ